MVKRLTSFQELMNAIDKDCKQSGRRRLHYSTSSDGENESNIVARSTLRSKNNTPALSFLIWSFTPESKDKYTLTYLSEIDVIEILSKLDKQVKHELWGFLSRLYRGEITPEGEITVQRAPIDEEQNYTVLYLPSKVVRIPVPDKTETVRTSFGFNINYYDFCECLSLMLSMEPDYKLKAVLAKYRVLSDLISDRSLGVGSPDIFADAQSASDLESIYGSISGKVEVRKKRDQREFGAGRYDTCFR